MMAASPPRPMPKVLFRECPRGERSGLAFCLLGKPSLDKQNVRPTPKASVIYEPEFNEKCRKSPGGGSEEISAGF